MAAERQNCNVKEHICAMAQLEMHKHKCNQVPTYTSASGKLIALVSSLIQPIVLAERDIVSIRARPLSVDCMQGSCRRGSLSKLC